MPGEEVVLAGTGWGSAVSVSFGEHQAQVLEATGNSIRVQVPPQVSATPGTSLAVTVSSGNESSNAAPFVVGRLPLLTAIEPSSALPGDVITVRGRGFPPQAAGTRCGSAACGRWCVSAVESELKVVVPWVEGRAAPRRWSCAFPAAPTSGQAA